MHNLGDKTKYFEWLIPKLLPKGLPAREHRAKHMRESEEQLTKELLVVEDDEDSKGVEN